MQSEGKIVKAIKNNYFELYPLKKELFVKGKKVNLTFNEFELVSLLIQSDGQVFSRYAIGKMISRSKKEIELSAIDTLVSRTRKKISVNQIDGFIETVYKFGYRIRKKYLENKIVEN